MTAENRRCLAHRALFLIVTDAEVVSRLQRANRNIFYSCSAVDGNRETKLGRTEVYEENFPH